MSGTTPPDNIGFGLLLAGALVGHEALCVASHNYWYGSPLPRIVVRSIQIFHGLLGVGVPLLFWMLDGEGIMRRLDWNHPQVPDVVFCMYVILCAFVGWLVFPWITYRRFRRLPPPLLLSNHTLTVDVAHQLGTPLLGASKHQFLARLPRNEIFQVDFSERTFHLPQLPASWDGLTILHVSDLHFWGTPDLAFYRYVMDRCAAWKPDLVALTGDYVDSDRHHRWVIRLLSRLCWREAAFAILGNHDQWFRPERIRRRLRRLRMRVLVNDWQQILIRGHPLVVIGHEGPWVRPQPDLGDCPQGAFRLCLSHTPDNLPWARQHGIDLMLSGHNHGGQVRFPLFGSVFVPSQFGRRYDCGIFHDPPTLLHVSRGLAGEHPLRYNCRPEVTLIILRQGRGET